MTIWRALRNRATWIVQAIVLAAMVVPSVAWAGSLSVMPVRVEVAPDKQFCSLTIGNDGTEDVTVQVRGYRWRQQPDGTDILDDANSIVVNPSIVQIPAGAKKLIRCGLPPQTGSQENTFRLLVNELPRPAASPGTLQTLLQLSIPVFRAQPDARPMLSWSLSDAGLLVISNNGTRHARVMDLAVRGGSMVEPALGHRSFYLLAGASRTVDPGITPSAVIGVDIAAEDGAFIALDRRPARGP